MRQTRSRHFSRCLLLVVLFAGGTALGQVDTVTYEGALRDAAGDPVVDGAYTVTFGLFPVATGGTALWTETHVGVPVQEGAFSVALGSVNSFNTLFQDNSGAPLWLQVSADVGAGLEAFTPRVPVTQVPYAAQAAGAQAATTVPWAGVTGVPADLADGDDVDGGTAASVPWAGVSGVPGDLADGDDVDGGDADTLDGLEASEIAAVGHTHGGGDVTSPVANADAAASASWAGILGVPADLADGDNVNGGVAAAVPWTGITGMPAVWSDGDNVNGGAAAAAPWAGVTGKPAGFVDGTDDVDGGNADTVDGQHASAFAPVTHSHPASQFTSGTVPIARIPVGDGAGQVASGSHTHDAAEIVSGTIPTSQLSVGTAGSQVAAGNHTHASTEYFIGGLGTQLSGYKVIHQQAASNISLTNGNTRLTVSQPGFYYIYCQQLSHSLGGGGFYFNLVHNGNVVIHAYNPGSTFVDLKLERMVYMNAGDWIGFNIGAGPQMNAWGYPQEHSSVSMFRVK